MNGQANRYHGLINQGSTCYLNSVLQVLFMTEDFREAVTRNSEENPHTEFIDHDLKVLFDDLQNHRAYTYKITKKLGINNVNEQRDAAEYFERILRMTSPDASKIFHGQLVNKTTCSEGHIQTDGDAPFWHLPLSLVDSCSEYYSVVKGIEEFFKPSDFCGENQMYCDQCDEKVDATMTDVIKHHPDVLCLLLKRFEFNYKYMSYIKINCSVDVPYTLKIPESQKYELYAFVDHFGDLRGGHYTATIKIQEEHRDRWYQFDDTRVTELDYQPFQLDNTERSKTAYLLFYRKNKADTGVQDFRDVSNIGSIPLTTSDEYDQSQDGKNQRKRRREGEETDIEYNPKAPRLREAEGSPHTPCNVDTPQKEPDEDNATTGSDDLDQKHTEVDDAKKNRPDDNPDFIPAVSDTSAVCDDLNRQYEMSKLMDDKTDKDEKAKDKQSEKKSHTEHSADTVGENICGHQENKQTTENYYSPCPNHAEEDEEKTKTDFQHDTKGKTSADKPTAETCCDTFQDKDKVDEGKENTLQDDHSHKHGNKHSDTMKMQEISVTHSNDNDVCVEREINNMKEDRRERNDDHKGDHIKFGQNTAGEVSGAAKTQEDVDVEEEMKVKEYEGNTEQIQIRKNSHLRPAGAEIIGGPRENQDDAANEKTKAESCQPNARAEIEEVTDGGHGSQKSEKVQATYEQKMQNHDGESFGTKMKNTGIEIVEKSSHGRSERRVKNNEGNTKKEEHGDRLYNFDDTGVTDLDYQPFQVDNTEKSESAYLLLCRKKKDTVTEEVKEMLAQNGGFPPSNTDNSDQCQEPGKVAEVHKYGQSIVNKMEETLSGNKILTFKDTQLQENVKSHKNADQAMVLKRNVDHDFNLEVNDNPAAHGHLKKQDVMNDGQKGLMDLRPERNEQTDKKWLSLTAHHKSHTDCQGSEGADASRKDTREYDGGRENIGKDYSSKSASVEADKVRTGQRKLLTRYDLFHGSPDEQTGSDRIQIIPKDNQMNEQRRISRFLNEPIEEDVMGEASDHDVTHSAHKDVSVQTQRRSVRDDRENTKESDKYIHMNEVTTENPDNSEAVKHEVSMRLDGKGQKTAEKIISVTRTSQSVGGVQIQSKEQKNECDTKQNQSEGNKITKERQTEKQAGGSDENIGLERFQPKARTGAQGLTEGGHGSTMSRLLVKIIDEEHTEIDSACKDDSQTKTIIKKTTDETTQDMTKWLEKQRNIRRSLNLEIDKEVTLDKMSTF